MRCPECSQRNSVAAKTCYSCGHKFKRKPLPISLKIGFAVFALIVVAWGAIAALTPSFTDPKNSLARIAKKVAEGSKNEGEAKQAKTEFDDAVRNFLKQNGTQPSAQISKSLQQALADGAFEVHVFDLPRGLTVVEIDTILQASDYVILKNGTNLKVSSVPGMEVFDAAKILGENAAPVVVMLGHTGGQGGHRPLIKVFSLLPDEIIDQTAKSVPEMKTEGSASFARNNKDVNIDYSMLSVGVNDKVFSANIKLPPGLPDDMIHGTLKWTNGHYEQSGGTGSGQLTALYAVAKMLSGADPAQFEQLLGKFAASLATKDGTPQEFTIASAAAAAPQPAPVRSSRHHRNNTAAPAMGQASYLLQGKTLAYNVALGRDKLGSWVVVDARKADLTNQQAGVAQSTTPDKDLNKAQPTDNKIVTATPKVTTPEPPIVETSTSKSTTKTEKPIEQVTTAAPTTKVEKTKQPDALTMVQPTKSKSEPKTTTPPPATEPEKVEPEPPKGSGQEAVGIGASVSDKIEVAQIKLRSGPGVNFKQVSTLPRGAKIKVIGKTSGWYKVRVNGKDGYVYGGFVDYKTPDAYETLTVQKAGTLTDDKAQPVGESKPGERLVVLGGSKDGKVRVQLSSGKTAYINKDAVDQQKDDTPQFVP